MRASTRTGGRDATKGVIPGRIALSVGRPTLPEPEGFRWRLLSDLARLESGHTPSRSKSHYWGGEIPWIGIRDATGNHGKVISETLDNVTQEGIENSSARLLPQGTVCLSRTASVGYVVEMGRPMATSQDFVNWVCGPELNPGYLRYVLMLEQESVRRFAHGTTHQTMYYPEAKALNVLVPERTTQDAIAEVLGALDDKIAVNLRAADLMESLTVALYRRATQGQLNEQALFDVFDFDFGEAFRGEHFAEPGEGRPLIRIRDLKTFRPQVWTTESRLGEVTVRPGDVVIGMDAEFRAVPWLGEEGLLNQRVCRVRGKVVGPAFALSSLREPLSALESEKSATTVIHLNKSDLARSVIRIPDTPRLEEFEAVAEPMLASRVALALENARLAATRRELLPLLMSGKVRVREAEKAVEGVV
ncbi:restriction endonuclease subunit S [Kribbella sp. NPDC050241]|uniref:restriction endonuclease subunit S n=1 Tax=Kribbella sp. NPDC050241 TaxID=3364115 RepID=UPI0037AEB452